MTPAEWEAFLRPQPVRKGQPGFKKWSTLTKWCTFLGWLPTGEDEHMYPSDPDLLRGAETAQDRLGELVHSVHWRLQRR